MIHGKRLMLGAIAMTNDTVGTDEEVVQTLRKALEYVDADKLIASSDCGRAPFRRDIALDKLSTGVGILHEELVGTRV